MRKVTVFIACAAFLAGNAVAQRPQFEFKGYKPGESAGDIASMPGWRCAQERIPAGTMTCITQRETIAGVPVKFLSLAVQDGAIKSVSVVFPSSSFEKVADAIQVKYGPPDNVRNRELQNRMGAKFLDVRMMWIDGNPQDGGPTMSLRKYTNDVTQSSLSIMNLPKADQLKEQQQEATKQRSEDL